VSRAVAAGKATRGSAPPPELTAISISKRFGPVQALERVSLMVKPGSFHALLGENGAGKSTLVKCVMGYYAQDSGRLLLDRNEVQVRSPRDAQALGIGMVYQHFTLVTNMTVAENMILARPELPFFIDWAAEHVALRELMADMPFQLDPAREVRTLSAGEKQKLEIMKQLYLGSRIIILDEPTSVLTPAESDEVLGLLKGMTGRGELSVLMISHKFREVMTFADEVTILRRGRAAGGGRVQDLTPAEMARMMVGAAPPRLKSERSKAPTQQLLLAVNGLSAHGDDGAPVLTGVDLTVSAHEIVGIAGVAGNGQEQLVEVLAGQRRASGGEVRVSGRPYAPSRESMRVLGVRCLPEEPLRNACVGTMTVAENIGMRSYDTRPFTFARWAVRKAALRRAASRLVERFRVKTPSVDVPIAELSGGNVQRAVLARVLGERANVLVAANPCFGLDFAAQAEIRTRLMEARNAGSAILLISADLDEVFALADRILVMSGGRIVHETPIDQADLATIGKCMAGHLEHEATLPAALAS